VLLAPHLRRLLFDLDRVKAAGDKVRRGLGVLRSFIGAIKVKVSATGVIRPLQSRRIQAT
jgi:hypothetical protein